VNGVVAGLSGRRVVAGGVVLLAVVVLLGLLSVTTASNTVPVSRLGSRTVATGIAELRPLACSTMTLTVLLKGTGNISGSNSAELILAARGAAKITGSGGNDCIVGGADATDIDGGAGTDVCIGPPAVKYKGCESTITR
jgi:hypothetical protein